MAKKGFRKKKRSPFFLAFLFKIFYLCGKLSVLYGQTIAINDNTDAGIGLVSISPEKRQDAFGRHHR
jgi:hypothetical protein